MKEKIEKINAKEDLRQLDLLCRKIVGTNFKFKENDSVIENLTGILNQKAFEIIDKYRITSEEYVEILKPNSNYERLEKRKEKMAEDRYNMIWENCTSKEIAEILRNNYEYTDEEILQEFDDEETAQEVEIFLNELKEIEEASKSIVLENGYTFVFENEYYFTKLKSTYENKQKMSRIPDGKEFATITNLDVTKEAFLVNYGENIEIVYNFYNKVSNEMETYETEVFDLEEIKSKEELIDEMRKRLEKFEEKFNALESEENMEMN